MVAAEAVGVGTLIIVLAMFGFILLLGIVTFVLLIWSIVDIAKAKNNGEWKALWILICIFGGMIGIIVYLAVGRKDKKV